VKQWRTIAYALVVTQNSDGNTFCMISTGEYISFFAILEPARSRRTTAAIIINTNGKWLNSSVLVDLTTKELKGLSRHPKVNTHVITEEIHVFFPGSSESWDDPRS